MNATKGSMPRRRAALTRSVRRGVEAFQIEWQGSPNFGYPRGTKGRNGYQPIAVVLHIMEGTMEAALSWFNDPQSEASSHYGLGKDGRIWQFVNEADAAWCNGDVQEPDWPLLIPEVNPNLYTISIEHEGKTGEPWTEAMFLADVWLIRQIVQRWNIPVDRDHVIGHYRLNAVDRVNCPGTGLPWERLMGELVAGAPPAPQADELLEVAWKALQVAYNPATAFFKYALANNLGIPLTNEFDFTIRGVSYRGQIFHKIDTTLVYAEVEKWDKIYVAKVG